MKKAIITTAITLSLFILPYAASADDHGGGGEGGGGFSGMIQAGAFWESSDSQLGTESDNEKITSLNDSADSVGTFNPIAFFEAKYTFPTGTGIYLETPFDEEFGLAAGIFQNTPVGSFKIGGFYGLEGEVWEDPYLLNVKRETTDTDIIGGDFNIDGIMGTGLELGYKYRSYDVDKDLIGKRFKDLQRDGSTHEIGVEYGFKLGRGNMIAPSFSYTIGDMDGESQSYSGYSGGLALMRMTENYMMHLELEGGLKDYDKTHPLFNDQREDKEYGAMAMVTWMNPLGLQNFFLNLGAGGGITDSNIDFYDCNETMSFLTFGYQFGGGGHHDDDD